MLALSAAALLLPAPAIAMPVPAGEFDDYTDCFTRSTAATPQRFQDGTNGNYWARHDTFTLDTELSGCDIDVEEGATIFGLSVIAKTPFQITPARTAFSSLRSR